MSRAGTTDMSQMISKEACRMWKKTLRVVEQKADKVLIEYEICCVPKCGAEITRMCQKI